MDFIKQNLVKLGTQFDIIDMKYYVNAYTENLCE